VTPITGSSRSNRLPPALRSGGVRRPFRQKNAVRAGLPGHPQGTGRLLKRTILESIQLRDNDAGSIE